MARQQILIFAEDPRLCRLLLREADAAGFEGTATTDLDDLERCYHSSVPDITFLEIDGPFQRMARFFRLVREGESGSLVLLSGGNGPALGELMGLASALRLQIAGVLHKPMGIEAIRAVLRRQERGTRAAHGRLATGGVDLEYQQRVR